MDNGQGIQIGDAVLEFLGDTQKLDASIDGLNTRVEGAMSRAGAATQQFGDELDSTGENAENAGETIQDAMRTKATPSIREAKGEAMLLGEAFGVHLPRHVTSFISTLPGVGEALSAAFSATAVLFVLEAVARLTQKVTDFISTTFIYTEQMKASEAATGALNSEIIKQEAALDAARKALDRVGLSAEAIAKLKIGDELSAQIAEINAALAKQNTSLQTELSWWEKLKLGATDVLRLKAIGTAAQEEMDERASKAAVERANNETQAEKARADARKTADMELATRQKENALQHAAIYKKEMADLADYEERSALSVLAEIDSINDALDKLPKGRNLGQMVLGNVDDFQKYEQAAQTLGVTLKSSLVTALQAATKAQADMIASGKALPAELQQAKLAVAALQDQVNKFGQDTPQVNAFFASFQKGGQQSEAAMWGFGDAYGQAIGKVINGEESMGVAMEAATKQFIGQIGQRALVQGMFYIAQGIADTFWNPARAGADFAAAAEFLAIGGAAVGASAAIPGGAGSSSGSGSGSSVNTSPIQTTGSTSQSAATHTNVQSFAGGGLISTPTLAMIGDALDGGSQSEAVLPLDHPESMAKIAKALAPHIAAVSAGGPGHTFAPQIFGSMPKPALRRLMKQMSHAVKMGEGLLHSSNTLRITKRSA